MYIIKPKNPSHLCGVSISTIMSNQKALLFLSPVLSKRGDGMRTALKQYEDLHKGKDDENEEISEEDKEKEEQERRKVTLKLMIESLKQQYYLHGLEKDEEETDELWIEAISEYFTEADLQRIPVSIRFGKEMSLADLMDMTKELKSLPKPEKN